jgi:hypothetical protein
MAKRIRSINETRRRVVMRDSEVVDNKIPTAKVK